VLLSLRGTVYREELPAAGNSFQLGRAEVAEGDCPIRAQDPSQSKRPVLLRAVLRLPPVRQCGPRFRRLPVHQLALARVQPGAHIEPKPPHLVGDRTGTADRTRCHGRCAVTVAAQVGGRRTYPALNTKLPGLACCEDVRDNRPASDKEERVPHYFVQMAATTPNPGRWTRARIEEIVGRHHGIVEHLWFDDAADPSRAYVLVQDGDVDGFMVDLRGHEVTHLYEAE
jgi:hypothetical protein